LLFVRPCVILPSRFQQVLGMTTCPKTETCHPEGIDVDFPGISARGVEQAVRKTP
jgi:hypothetical protein